MPDEACAASPEPEQDGRSALPHGLVLVSTPIGNLGDLTPRARDTLRAADLILCEDTRHTARLLVAIGVKAKMRPLHEHNEDAAIPSVLGMLRQGLRVALVSDAGVPLVSDPGFRLVRAAIAEGLPVGGVPGANAAVTALVLSGLPPLPFLMLGFPPPRQAARRAAFGGIRAAERAGLAATLIWYEAPHRLAETLGRHGRRIRRSAGCGGARADQAVRGGAAGSTVRTCGALCRECGARRGDRGCGAAGAGRSRGSGRTTAGGVGGNSVKDAAALVAVATGLPRKLVYARALALGRE